MGFLSTITLNATRKDEGGISGNIQQTRIKVRSGTTQEPSVVRKRFTMYAEGVPAFLERGLNSAHNLSLQESAHNDNFKTVDIIPNEILEVKKQE